MPASEFRNKAAVFVLVSGIVILILVLMPFAEAQLESYFLNHFGIAITPEGHSVPVSGQDPGMMVGTSVSLAVNILHIFKIFLWMALVIAVVRFVGYMIVSTIIRGSQSEVSSLVKTVLSIIIYIVAF